MKDRSMSRQGTRLAILFGACLALAGCADNGIGMAHHPIDCAIGIPWGDCLPGTGGYREKPVPPPETVGWVHVDGTASTPTDVAKASYACLKDVGGQPQDTRTLLFNACMGSSGWSHGKG
jgi:hypothetical protein